MRIAALRRTATTSVLTIVATALIAVAAPPAFAQATRTWVSGVGDDANPCSRTAPCKTWAGAITKTAVGGIINALDSGGFGPVTVTKSITLDGTGTAASILATGTSGVFINNVDANVVLRNLDISARRPEPEPAAAASTASSCMRRRRFASRASPSPASNAGSRCHSPAPTPTCSST